jgi:hypothetical protein
MMANKCTDGTSPPSPEYGIYFEKWKNAVMKGDNVIDDPGVSDFNSSVTSLCELRTFSLSEKGYVGLVPSTTR